MTLIIGVGATRFWSFGKSNVKYPKLQLIISFMTFRALDLTHTSLVWASVWDFMVVHFADWAYIDHIPEYFCTSLRYIGA